MFSFSFPPYPFVGPCWEGVEEWGGSLHLCRRVVTTHAVSLSWGSTFSFCLPSLFFLELSCYLSSPFHRPTFPQSCSTWWLCVAAFVSVTRLSELLSPSLSPPSFSLQWHVNLVERVKECNPLLEWLMVATELSGSRPSLLL